MTSIQAAVLARGLRLMQRRDALGEIASGARPALHTDPTGRVRRRCAVRSPQHAGRPVWWIEPIGPWSGTTVLFVHGGAYVNGFHAFHWDFISHLVQDAGVRVCAPDYPLAPDATVEEVTAWVGEIYRSVASTPGPFVVMGDSAGAGLALSVVVGARDEGIRVPDRLVLLCPWLDVSMGGADAVVLDAIDPFLSREGLQACGVAYAAGGDVRDPRVSPLFADLRGLPPTDLYAATHDQLWSDSRRLRWRAAMEYPEWDLDYSEGFGMVHDWMIMPPLPEAQRTRQRIVERLP